MNWLSACLFSHAPDPIKVVKGTVLHFECQRCLADLGPVLAGQRFRPRKVKKPSRKVQAQVLSLAERRKA
jgi:hypothetical protein